MAPHTGNPSPSHPIDQITFEIKSLLKFKLDLKVYPTLHSDKKWIQKGINMLKKTMPKVLNYLSKQKVLAHLNVCKVIIEIEEDDNVDNNTVKTAFKVWVQKERFKRLIYVILESLIIPATPILAMLPGPNVFFYVPALLLYYHFISFQGLSKVDVDDLDLTFVRI
jgi:hypothetical protein